MLPSDCLTPAAPPVSPFFTLVQLDVPPYFVSPFVFTVAPPIVNVSAGHVPLRFSTVPVTVT